MKWRLDSVLEETFSVSDSCGTGYMKLQIGRSWIGYVIIDPFILGVFFFKKNFFIKFFNFFFFNFYFILNFFFFFLFYLNFLETAMDFLDLLKRILKVGFRCERVG